MNRKLITEDERQQEIEKAIHAIANILFPPSLFPLDDHGNIDTEKMNQALFDLYAAKDELLNSAVTCKMYDFEYMPGVYAILGEQRSGKTTYAEALAREIMTMTGVSSDEIDETLVRCSYTIEEPVDDPRYMQPVLYEATGVAKALTEMINSDDKVFVLDSLRTLINSLPGAYAKGGISVGFKQLLTQTQILFGYLGKYLIEVYTTDADLVGGIIASCCGLIYVCERKYCYQHRKCPHVGGMSEPLNKKVFPDGTFDGLKPINLTIDKDVLPEFELHGFPIRSAETLRLAMLGVNKAAKYLYRHLSLADAFFVEKNKIYNDLEMPSTTFTEVDRAVYGDDDIPGATSLNSHKFSFDEI